MNEQTNQTHAADAATTATANVPAGYERREVIWPGTNERISVLLPLPNGWVD